MPHPNPVTAEQLAASTGRDASEFEAVLADLDQQALFDAQRAQLVAAVWDGRSPVNGVDAQTVFESLNPPAGGVVVMVSAVDGLTRVLQPTDPATGAAIPLDDGQAVADRIADEIAADAARSDVLQQLPVELLTPVEGSTPGGGGEQPPAPPTVEELQAQLDGALAAIEELRGTDEWLVGLVTEGNTEA